MRTALRGADITDVVVIVYESSEVTPIPLPVRANWIRETFAGDVHADGRPRVHVIEAWDGPTDSGDTTEVKLIQERFLVGLLEDHGYGPGRAAWRKLRGLPDDASATAGSTGGGNAGASTSGTLVACEASASRSEGGGAAATPAPAATGGSTRDASPTAAAQSSAAPTLRPIVAFYCSEFYGEHVSEALGAEDRRVDADRTAFPISGTACRADPYACRSLMPRCVYRSHVTSVVFMGAPSTGKSTITEAMAAAMGTTFMPEYGREYWDKHAVNRRLSPAQLVEIAEGHLERENALLDDAKGYLFVDTNAITTYMFGLAYHGSVLPRLRDLAQAAATRYDLVFLCEDDIPYADTW